MHCAEVVKTLLKGSVLFRYSVRLSLKHDPKRIFWIVPKQVSRDAIGPLYHLGKQKLFRAPRLSFSFISLGQVNCASVRTQDDNEWYFLPLESRWCHF